MTCPFTASGPVARAQLGAPFLAELNCPEGASVVESNRSGRTQKVRVNMCCDIALAGPACLNTNAPLRRGRILLSEGRLELTKRD